MRRRILLLTLAGACVIAHAMQVGSSNQSRKNPRTQRQQVTVSEEPPVQAPLREYAFYDTTEIYSWNFEDGAGGPDPQGWTPVDATVQPGVFFHVDDFIGAGGDFGGLVPISGSKSLWCGARAAGGAEMCRYLTLPGYGNNWDQVFESVTFPVTGAVNVSYRVRYEVEPSYEDVNHVSYLSKSDLWHDLVTYRGGSGSGLENFPIPPDSLNGSTRFRFRFHSDYAWSDEDGKINTDGAIIVDDILITDANGTVDSQDFESEAVGALTTSDGDWSASGYEPFGDHAALVNGASVLQEAPVPNLTSMWAFINGSTDTYACGGHPTQLAVPLMKRPGGDVLPLRNEIWSPVLTRPPGVDGFILAFDVYRDLSLAAVVVYSVRVRSFVDGCWTAWTDNNLYLGNQKDWYPFKLDLKALLDPNGTAFQIALGARDYCPQLCGTQGFGDGSCHSHAPLFDNVSVSIYGDQGPTIELANPATLRVEGFVQSAPSTSYTVRIYASPACNPSGSGPGDTLLGSTVVATANDGWAHFNAGVSSMPAGQVLTATSTDPNNVTSVFSKCFPVPAVHTVTNTATSGAGSLVQAVIDANSDAYPSVVTFAIPGAGPHTISLTGSLELNTQITIDGLSQPGATRNQNPIDQASNTVHKIAFNGSIVFLNAPACVLRNVNLQNCGVAIQGVDRCRIEGCYIGTDITGTTAIGAAIGVDVSGAHNTIGSRYIGARNVIAASGSYGVRLSGGLARRNVVQGNFIGVGADGTTDLGNSAEGVLVQNGPNLIGGSRTQMRNVIAGNGSQQIDLRLDSCDSTRVEGNYVGVNRTATALVETGAMAVVGINVNEGDDNVIVDNVVGGQTYGIRVIGNTLRTIIQGNIVGTDPTETATFAMGAMGIALTGGTGAKIGGLLPGEGNLVMNCPSAGIAVQGATTINNSIAGNRTRSNAGLGIDLGSPTGVTPNDPGDTDSGSNNLQNFPVLTSAATTLGKTTVTGSFTTSLYKLVRVEYFSSPSCNAAGHGEGAVFLDGRVFYSGATGTVNFSSVIFTPVAVGSVITTTATVDNNTSEYSACVTVVNTPPGLGIVIIPVDVTTGTTPVQMLFGNVSSAGTTSLVTGPSGPPIPGQFSITDPSLFYNLTTTAAFSGAVAVCVNYNEANLQGAESAVRLLHYDTTALPPQWVDITTSLDVNTNTVCGSSTSLSPFAVVTGTPTAVGPTVPDRFALAQNIPNPFNPSTVIVYDIPGGGAHVTLRIYDVAGRLVRTLVDQQRAPGHWTVAWDGTNTHGVHAVSGVYFYRMQAGSFTSTRKMLLLK